MNSSKQDLMVDVQKVGQISIVPSLLDVICRTTGMGFAAISRVTEDTWIACSTQDDIGFGLKPGDELKIETTFCNTVRQTDTPVIIENAAEDEEYADHFIPKMYGIVSYISIPIYLKDGRFFGTLCGIDVKPAAIKNQEVIGMFNLFSDLISFHLESLDKLHATEKQLSEELKTAELREQFIAILGHDLRNPVGAAMNSAEVLLQLPVDDHVKNLATTIKNSTYRMSALIENILDFARGRLGDGIILKVKKTESLGKIFMDVISEMMAIWPNRNIQTHLDLKQSVNCDPDRINQLFGNLLSNAVTHGDAEKPIVVRAHSDEDELVVSVSNSGKKIPDKALPHLFKPFSRTDEKSGQQGLGLGLYISSEIARAHGGELMVSSTDEETRFTFRMENPCI